LKRLAFPLGVSAAALAAILTHVGSLGAPFFADDWLFLDQVRFRSLAQVLASPDPLGNFFRPLGRQVWFWLFARLGGESPGVFHAANLACLVAAVVLLALLGRRVAGPFAGVVAAAFLAVHYAADVPVLWASGSQELLSLALALVALMFHVNGRRALAAVAMLLALLAKEAVVLAPLAAIALDDTPGGWRVRTRRAWPLAAAVLAWLALAVWAMARRGAHGTGLALTPLGPLVAPLLLVRVALGLEWQTGALPLTRFTDPGATSVLALFVAGAAVWFAGPPPVARPAAKTAARSGRGARRGAGPQAAPAPPSAAAAARERPRDPVHAVRAGLVWALAGALPVAAVAPVWSAYYFLFAIAGVGLAFGAAVTKLRWRGPAAAVVLLAAGLASSQARGLEEFATAPASWSGQSHVNRFYLQRGMRVISRCVADLRRQLPRPERRTTFFFAGLPSFASFQVADGPLVRGVYRDSTLLGYYLSQFTRERMARGPWRVFFFDQPTGRLVDRTHERGVFMSTALGQIMNGHLDIAEAALVAARENGENDLGCAYLAGLVALDQGDRARADTLFGGGRHVERGDGAAAVRRARAQLAQRDSLGALLSIEQGLREDVYDPEVHSLAADLMLRNVRYAVEGQVEAYAARVLAPASAPAWRRWAFVLAIENRQEESIAALDRYFQLDSLAAARDHDAVKLRALEVRMLPGGDIAQRAMRKELMR
jgi:hypothetical protein